MINSLRLAVIGKPVLHSRSPQIHRAALKVAGIDGAYLRLAVESGAEGMRVAQQLGLHGFNVTAPFKEEIYRAVDSLSPEAKAIGAVNTVVLTDSGSVGYNTDVAGIVTPLQKKLGKLSGKHVLILGAGGAARAAAYALTHEGCTLTVANRTLEHATRLVSEFSGSAVSLTGADFAQALSTSEIVINTIARADAEVGAEKFLEGQVLLESSYSKVSSFAKKAQHHGVTVLAGLEWLIEQGVAAFQIFTGQSCSSETMRAALSGELAPEKDLLALIGMMGSGKSVVAERIAAIIQQECVDIDVEISRQAGLPVGTLFQTRGEEAFRELEMAVLHEAVKKSAGIISAGGGIVVKEQNRNLLSRRAQVAWLWANPTALATRIGAESHRPLLAGTDPEEKLTDLLRQRWSWYAATCDFVVPTEFYSPEEVASRVVYETNCAR